MNVRAASWIAWFFCALTVAFSSLSLLMPTEQYPPSFLLPLGAMMVAYSAVGSIIVSRRSGNSIGWILCSIGFLFAFNNFAGLYAFRAVVAHPGSLPAGQAAAWFAAWLSGPAWGLFPYLLLLFPDGRPLSGRWRSLLWFGGVLIALASVTGAIYSGPIGFGAVRNPLGIGAVEDVIAFVGNVGFYLFTALMLLSIVSVYLRFRRAGGTERQQIKWLAYAAALVGVFIVVDVSNDMLLGGFGRWFDVVLTLALLCLPLSIGVSVLRYRLYDIDLLINRTLVYGSLTLMLIALYFGGVVASQRLFVALSGQRSTLAVVASTLLIAALFNPLRRRIQRFIDRRFYRRRFDARKTFETFSARLRNETDLQALNDDLVGVVRETVQPEYVGLWLRSPTEKGRGRGS